MEKRGSRDYPLKRWKAFEMRNYQNEWDHNTWDSVAIVIFYI